MHNRHTDSTLTSTPHATQTAPAQTPLTAASHVPLALQETFAPCTPIPPPPLPPAPPPPPAPACASRAHACASGTHLRGVERLVVLCVFIRPAQRAEGPQPAAEPGVQHVALLHQHLARPKPAPPRHTHVCTLGHAITH